MFSPSTRSCLARIAILVCLIAIAVAEADPPLGKPSARRRIIGGQAITIDKAPYTVQMKDTFGLFLCGGTIVSPRYIVTAAHCVESRFPTELNIVAGATTLSETGGVVRQVEEIFMAPEYDRDTLDMDVAVLKLEKDLPINGKTISIMKMCDTPLKPNTVIQVSGWGLTNETNEVVSDQLRTVRVRTITFEDCAKQQEDVDTPLTKSMLCASEPGAKDSCSGDSGGPAIQQNTLCGIVSWGVGCGRSGYPGIYTSIPVVRAFIDESMRK